jgi:hypothetical protein
MAAATLVHDDLRPCAWTAQGIGCVALAVNRSAFCSIHRDGRRFRKNKARLTYGRRKSVALVSSNPGLARVQ